MAAPYAAAPHTTPAAIPTDDGLTGRELSTLPPIGAPSFPVGTPEEDEEASLPVLGDAPSVLSARIGKLGLIKEKRVLTLLSGFR